MTYFRYFIAALLVLSVGCSDDGGSTPQDIMQIHEGPLADLFPPWTGDGPPLRADQYPQQWDGPPTFTDGPPIPRDKGPTGSDSYVPPAAKCGGTATLQLQEIATGQPDYVALKNTGGAPVDLNGFQLVMMGINLETFTFSTGTSVSGGQTLYVFEYSAGQTGDIQTGNNIPFYDDLSSGGSNSVALYDASGNLLDFVAIGAKLVSVPPGAQATLFAWTATYDPDKESIQHTGATGKCPNFKAADWAAKTITRTPSP